MSGPPGRDLRRVLAVRGERHRGRPALVGPADRAPRIGRGGRPGRRVSALVWGSEPARDGVHPRRRSERPHLGHGGPGPRPAPGRRRPARARALGLARGRPGARPRGHGRRRGRGHPPVGARRPHGGGHVARGHDRHRPGRPPSRPGQAPGAGRHHPRGRPREELGHRRLPGRTGDVRLVRRDPRADHPVQPHPVRVVAAPGRAPQCRPAGGRDLDLAPPAGPARRRPPGSTWTRSISAPCGTTSSTSSAPVLLARGKLSPVVDDADEAEFRRRRPADRVVTVEDAGHSIQGDQPVELARILDDFFVGP